MTQDPPLSAKWIPYNSPMENRSFETQRIRFFGSCFDNVSYDEVCEAVDRCVDSGKPGYMMSLNTDILIKADSDPAFKAALEGANLVLMDSTPLMKLAAKEGIQVKEKLSGSDLMPRICQFAADRGYKCGIFGGKPGVPEMAKAKLEERFPNLQVIGCMSPPFGFEKDAAKTKMVLGEVRDWGADIVFLCLGEPKSGLLVSRHLEEMGVSYVFNVGAAVDFAAGNMPRAPKWMQDAGLEWLYRFVKEPRRLFKRYFVDSWHIITIMRRNKD